MTIIFYDMLYNICQILLHILKCLKLFVNIQVRYSWLYYKIFNLKWQKFELQMQEVTIQAGWASWHPVSMDKHWLQNCANKGFTVFHTVFQTWKLQLRRDCGNFSLALSDFKRHWTSLALVLWWAKVRLDWLLPPSIKFQGPAQKMHINVKLIFYKRLTFFLSPLASFDSLSAPGVLWWNHPWQ